MKATKFYEFGPGDISTWPPCMNHAHDPRTPEADGGGEVEAIEDAIKDAREWLEMAEVAAFRGDWPAARQRLIEARLCIEGITGDAS